MKKIALIIVFFGILTLCNAQSSYQYGIIPSLNLHKKFQKDWAANFKIESRQYLYYNEFEYDYSLTDASLIVTKRIAPSITVGGGYLLRYEGDEFENRLIQQISFTKKYQGFRLAHRFMCDQNFGSNSTAEYRIRYRISSEIPLQGQSIDVSEFFLKMNNEYVNSWQTAEYDLEIRWQALFGYSVSDKSDLELGLDYRLDSFIYGDSRNRMWLSINFFYSLGND